MKKWLCAAVAAIALLGCAENTAGLRVEGANQTVIFNDNVLGSRLLIQDITTTQSDGRARGVVQLESNYKADQVIQYRFHWYDDEGLEVNLKPGPWRRAIVYGYDRLSISEVSLNPNGTNFRVQIREYRD